MLRRGASTAARAAARRPVVRRALSGGGGGGGGKEAKTWLLEKFLARAGVSSRREGKRLAQAGRVRVDGRPADHTTRVRPDHAGVELDGRPVSVETAGEPRLWLYYKPPGEIVHENSRHAGGRTRLRHGTVHDAVARRHGERLCLPDRLITAGRLDVASEGLLPLTNHGAVATALMHPAAGFERAYLVSCPEPLPPHAAPLLAAGVEIDGVRYRPAEVRGARPRDARAAGMRTHGTDDSRASWYEVRVREGKNREVRRLMAHFGAEVRRLCRVQFGPLTMPPGARPGDMVPVEPSLVAEILERGLKADAERRRRQPQQQEQPPPPPPAGAVK